MNWYNIEIEIPFYGKEFELTDASNEQEAKLIAINWVVHKYVIQAANANLSHGKPHPIWTLWLGRHPPRWYQTKCNSDPQNSQTETS